MCSQKRLIKLIISLFLAVRVRRAGVGDIKVGRLQEWRSVGRSRGKVKRQRSLLITCHGAADYL